MKKLLVLVVVGLLALTGLTGCAAKTYKFGTGSYTSVSGRAATAEAAGRVQVTSIYAAVLLDDAGKVIRPMATCGTPAAFNQEISKICHQSSPC